MMPLSGVRISCERHGEEARFGAVGGIGLVARLGQRALGLGAVGDVAADALHLGGLAGIVPDTALAPGDPARRRAGVVDLLVVHARAVRSRSALSPCSRTSKSKRVPISALARLSGERAIGVVGEGDAAFGGRAARSGRPAVRTGCGRALRLPSVPSCGSTSASLCAASCCICLLTKRSRMLSVASAEAGEREQEARADRKACWDRSRNSASGCRRRSHRRRRTSPEKIMKERIANAMRGCRRPKRRMRTLIRNVRPIAIDPDSAWKPRRRQLRRCLADLANSLRLWFGLQTGLTRC